MSGSMRGIALVVSVSAVVFPLTAGLAQEAGHIPLAAGLTLVSANRGASGDRENVVRVGAVSA